MKNYKKKVHTKLMKGKHNYSLLKEAEVRSIEHIKVEI